MNELSVKHRLLLRVVVSCYLLMFLAGLLCSLYLLQGVIREKPMAAIGLAKYILLCVLFAVLSITAMKAFTLKAANLHRLTSGTKNFKWLFIIAVVLTVLARFGIFDLGKGAQVKVSYLQISVLMILATFCFWSDKLLQGEQELEDETEKEGTEEEGTKEDVAEGA